MKKLILPLILSAATFALLAHHPQRGDANGGQSSPAATIAAPVNDLGRGLASDALTEETLLTMVRGLGYEPTTRKSGDRPIHHLKIVRGTWTYEIDVSLSTNKRKVWLSCWFKDMSREPTASEFAALLEASFKHGPAHFTYTPATRTLNLGMALDNRAITPEILRFEMDIFMDVIRDTQPLWNLR